MSDDKFDIGADAAGENPAAHADLMARASELEEIDGMIEAYEGAIKEAKKRRLEITQREMPELMQQLRIDEQQLPDGKGKLKLGEYWSGSLPKREDDPEAYQIAMDHLLELEGDGMIKTTISMDFGKGSHNEANAVFEDLKAAGHEPERKTGVHPQSLYSFCREAIAAGKELDEEKLGVTHGRVVKVQKPRKKKTG